MSTNLACCVELRPILDSATSHHQKFSSARNPFRMGKRQMQLLRIACFSFVILAGCESKQEKPTPPCSRAGVAQAQIDVNRYTPLVAQRAVSQAELDKTQSSARAATAEVDAEQQMNGVDNMLYGLLLGQNPSTIVRGASLAECRDSVRLSTIRYDSGLSTYIDITFNAIHGLVLRNKI